MNLTEITLEQMESAQRKDFAWFLARYADCGNIFKARDMFQAELDLILL